MGYEIVRGNVHGLSDVSKFLETLSTFFDPHAELTITRAPGRLDVMGGIADYSGSLVLEMPIAEATITAVQKSDDRKIIVRTISRDGSGHAQFDISLSDIASEEYHELRAVFSADPTNHWASY